MGVVSEQWSGTAVDCLIQVVSFTGLAVDMAEMSRFVCKMVEDVVQKRVKMLITCIFLFSCNVFNPFPNDKL